MKTNLKSLSKAIKKSKLASPDELAKMGGITGQQLVEKLGQENGGEELENIFKQMFDIAVITETKDIKTQNRKEKRKSLKILKDRYKK